MGICHTTDMSASKWLGWQILCVFYHNKNIGKKAKSKNELTDTYYNTDKPVHTK